MIEAQAVQLMPEVDRYCTPAIQTPIAEVLVGVIRQRVHIDTVHFSESLGTNIKT
jgi:hypothetical protein